MRTGILKALASASAAHTVARLTCTAAVMLVMCAPAAAQQAGGVAPPTRNELTPPALRGENGERATLTVDGQMERRACALDAPGYADITVRLDTVTYTGAERAPDVALAQAHEGYLGRDLPIRALCDIRDRAAALLAAAGYLAAVEIPAQNLGGGTAEMRVVLGRMVAIRARGDTGGAEQLLAGYLGKLVGQDVFNVKAAERYLLLANDLPGTEVRLSLRPVAGGQPGDLVGEVAVLRRAVLADLTIQNLGSRALGRFSGLARAELYGLTGNGDRTTIALFATPEFSEQLTVQLGHEMRLGSEGLTLGGQLTLGWTAPDTLPGFDVESETVLASLYASYPLVRTQQASLWAASGIDIIDQDVTVNTLDLTRDRVRTAFVRASFETMDERSIARRGGYSPYEPQLRTFGEVELRKGLDIFGAARDCRGAIAACTTGGAVPPSRIEQNPQPFFIRARMTGEYRPDPLLTLAFDLRGQASGDPLPAFEEFAGGNFAIGRGYDPAAVIGDSGIGTGLELRYGSLRPQTADDLALQPYVFTDMARTWNEDPSLAGIGSDSLVSVGGGLRFVRGSFLLGDFALAVPLRRTNSQASLGDVRFLFTLTARHAPWRSR